ncbi:uncharacterized protein UMAG_00636 [Mycosarcoma maydis]|uniref:Uncharacterized protein n=1 Tax=Mycosarcoma maydis TaxID=5270 RepID=A0A0D1EAD5_MYCMD|nr:uncharacterized protein UMAG_00636 [Ustilago maydis 521]KIS72221.1 hypothetical protein UMAG_00636 [Ustilago maydis 521]|eukprot:XP_011386450.1 hypothetical protein UMAG_00636 [Ustilago maydis 521]
MVTRIPNEDGTSHTPLNYFELHPRRLANSTRRDVQATLSSFRFSQNTVESPTSGTTEASSLINSSDDEEYVEPLCIMDASSRRPSVQRTSSAPEPSSSKSTLFVEPSDPSVLRPSLARSCSESRASGVLERRRRKLKSRSNALPSTLILDLANLPMTIGASNVGLLRAARKAIAEPTGFDWGRAAVSAPPSSNSSRFVTHQEQKPRMSSPFRTVKLATTMSLSASTASSTWRLPESPHADASPLPSRSCAGSYWSNRASSSEESEWDWALSGNARATHDALRYSTHKEKRAPVHDIWNQLPDWMSRRSSLGGRDADLSLRGPGLFNSLGMSKLTKDSAPASGGAAAPTPSALALSLSQASLSNLSPRNSISGRGRAAQASMCVP